MTISYFISDTGELHGRACTQPRRSRGSSCKEHFTNAGFVASAPGQGPRRAPPALPNTRTGNYSSEDKGRTLSASGAFPPPPLTAPRGSERWIFYWSLNGHRKGQDSKLWHPHAQPSPAPTPCPPLSPDTTWGQCDFSPGARSQALLRHFLPVPAGLCAAVKHLCGKL